MDRSRPLPSGGHGHQLERQSARHSEESPPPPTFLGLMPALAEAGRCCTGNSPEAQETGRINLVGWKSREDCTDREPRALVLSSYFVCQFLILPLYCVNSANCCLQPQTSSVL